jgi:hypothetical protein
MRGWWKAALGAAAALTVAGARAGGESPCELNGAIRRTTGSRSCVSCHDGTAAPAISQGTGSAYAGVTSHPVGISYAEAASRHPGTYVPPSQLPKEIVLVGGKVECTTCHDGTSTLPHRVAGESELCLACHRL